MKTLDSAAADLQRLALAEIKQGRPLTALTRFKVAHKLAPHLPGIHLDHARLLTCLHRLDQARHHVETALTTFPDEPDLNLAAAQILTDARSPQRALALLQKFPAEHTARFKAATLLERQGHLPQALAQLQDLTTFGSQLLKARILRRQDHLSQSLDLLNSLKKHSLKPWPAALLHYALGATHDALGNYSSAFQAWTTAKSHLLPLAGNRLADSDRDFQNTPTLTRPQLLALQEKTPPNHPKTIFLTGFPRSGTTLLDQLLTRHFHSASADENTAYRDLIHKKIGTPSDYHQALQQLADATPDFTGHLIDKNPQLLPSLPLILRQLPHLKVLTIHRDPRDVLVSCFAQPFGLNHHSIHYLDPAWFTKRYLAVIAKSHQLNDILQNQQTQVSYQDLVSNPKETLTKIATSLELTPNTNDQTQPRLSYSPTYAEVAKPITTAPLGRWKNYQPYLATHFEALLNTHP